MSTISDNLRPVPALPTEVQRLLNLAFMGGLIPFIEDHWDDDRSYSVAFLPHQAADPERDTDWLLSISRIAPKRDVTLFGPPAHEGGDTREWWGPDAIAEALRTHLPAVRGLDFTNPDRYDPWSDL